jgi:Mg2+ and Co2+ transporter CorA
MLLLKQPCRQFSRQCKEFNRTPSDVVAQQVAQQVAEQVAEQVEQVVEQAAEQEQVVEQALHKQHRKRQPHSLIGWLLLQLPNLEKLQIMLAKWPAPRARGLTKSQAL